MPITDAEAIRYVNEVVRPKAEQCRALKAEIDAALTQWFGGLNAAITNDAEAIDDGREAEGVSRLTGADVHSLVGVLANLQTTMGGAGVGDVIAKPCVRPLSAE